ncbi:hypothetical protein CF326_g9308, partial [Tilletia indica]
SATTRRTTWVRQEETGGNEGIEAAAAEPRSATHRDSLRLMRQGGRRTVKGQGAWRDKVGLR